VIIKRNHPITAFQVDPEPTTELDRRRAGDLSAKAAAGVLARDWSEKPRGAVRQYANQCLCLFGHDGDPEHDERAKQCVQITGDTLDELGIGVLGFGVQDNTWCIVTDCRTNLEDQFENLVNAAWLAAVGDSNQPLKKARKVLCHRLSTRRVACGANR
jgi:hypothetical protein